MVSGGAHKLAFLFPGQASQRAGMARELLDQYAEARELFQRAGELLGLDLAELCTEGEDALLTRTDIAQPALLTTCLAWLAALTARGVKPALLAGHSLGEFAAWTASGAIEFEAALRLVRRRAELMADAAERHTGSMLAAIGLRDEQVVGICERAREEGVIVAANFNAPGQVVISGEERALERAAELVKQARGRALPIRVSGAFHSPLMDDAARSFAQLVGEASIRDPRIPVVANATAEPAADAAAARAAMTRQMSSPVRWSASVRRMIAEGVTLFVEVGPGQVLTKLTPRIAAEARCLPSGTREELDAVVKEVAQ